MCSFFILCEAINRNGHHTKWQMFANKNFDTRYTQHTSVSVESTGESEWKWKSSHVVSEWMLHLICNEISWWEIKNNLLIGAECVATSAAVLAWIQLALLHIVGARSALETFRAMAFEITTGQRCACAAIVARRWRAQILLFTIFACGCRKKFGFNLNSLFLTLSNDDAITCVSLCTRTNVIGEWLQCARTTILTRWRVACAALFYFTQWCRKSDRTIAAKSGHTMVVRCRAIATILASQTWDRVAWVQMLTKFANVTWCATAGKRERKKNVEINNVRNTQNEMKCV